MSKMRELDREVDAMLAKRQALDLGSPQTDDPRRTPELPAVVKPERTAYATEPATVNPPVEELPVEKVATTQPVELKDPTVVPEGVTPRNLESLLAYAIENSRDYRSRKEELFLINLNLLIERHLWGPRFFDSITARAVGTPEAGDHDQALELVNELGVTQRLPYGGSVSAAALVSFTDELRNAGGAPLEQTQTAELVLSGVLPLLRGAGQAAREDLIQAERELVYATRRFERSRREFLLDTSTRYFDLLLQRANIVNLKNQVRNFQRLSARMEALAAAGREPWFQAERAQQQLLFTRNNLSNAYERYAANLDAFKLFIGMPVEEPLAILDSDLQIPEPVLDMVTSVQTATRLRLDLQTQTDRVEDARRKVRVAENQLLPDLDVYGNVSLPTDSSQSNPGLNLEAGEGSYETGIRVGLPLDRRIEEIRKRQALVRLEQAQRENSRLRDQIALDVRSSIREIERAKLTLELQERNVQLAQRRKTGVLLRERSLGPRDSIEAEQDLLEALTRRDIARRDLRVSILQYLLDTEQLRVAASGQWLAPTRLVEEGENAGREMRNAE